jgi:hypothetical protein
MKSAADPKPPLFAEDSTGEAIGFTMAHPDVNSPPKGLDRRRGCASSG